MNSPSFFLMNPRAHFMIPGDIGFIPPWIFLFIVILAVVLLFPKLFRYPKDKYVISPNLLAFLIGSIMPIIDDLSTFVFGPPFAHHSLFHSFIGSIITYTIFRIISTKEIAKFAFLGNLTHIFFNFYFDYVALFFPFTYQETGLADIIRVNTYWIKAIHYPIILLLFVFAILRFFLKLRNPHANS